MNTQSTSPTTQTAAPSTNVTKMKSQRTVTTGLFEVRSGSETVLMDLRERHASLATPDDQDAQADVVLLFPDDMDLQYSEPVLSKSQPQPQLKMIHLPQPRPLRDLMQALTDPAALERQAAKVEQFPVRLHSPRASTSPSSESSDE